MEQDIMGQVLNRKPAKPGIVKSVWNGIEGVYGAFGLMGSESSAPAKRFIFTGIVVYGVLYLIKPEFAYAGTRVKPWLLTSPEDPEATTLPAWMVALVGAGFGGLFV